MDFLSKYKHINTKIWKQIKLWNLKTYPLSPWQFGLWNSVAAFERPDLYLVKSGYLLVVVLLLLSSWYILPCAVEPTVIVPG